MIVAKVIDSHLLVVDSNSCGGYREEEGKDQRQ
jgi:hypothetical protein